MCLSGEIDLHFWLTRSVGRCIGLNFCRALDQGRLSPETYMQLVQACRECPHVASCQSWLGDQRGAASTDRAPDFCRNGPALDALNHP
ncbi:DUF6455 family protein [Tropicimonas sp. IMCC34043]|uniref:DUF6455 family protein n=1 Tax=Tropicimonas sp. IMCC34043 TaxID=2248760 RepID=UPI000E27E29E|nr:DUF6455 family protein [Tropicimonas sp. IMCC34043]